MPDSSVSLFCRRALCTRTCRYHLAMFGTIPYAAANLQQAYCFSKGSGWISRATTVQIRHELDSKRHADNEWSSFVSATISSVATRLIVVNASQLDVVMRPADVPGRKCPTVVHTTAQVHAFTDQNVARIVATYQRICKQAPQNERHFIAGTFYFWRQVFKALLLIRNGLTVGYELINQKCILDVPTTVKSAV